MYDLPIHANEVNIRSRKLNISNRTVQQFRNVSCQCYVIGFWHFYLDKSQNYKFVIFTHFRIGRIANSIFDQNSLSRWIYRKKTMRTGLSCQLPLINYSDAHVLFSSILNLKLNTFISFYLLWEQFISWEKFIRFLEYLIFLIYLRKKTSWISIWKKKINLREKSSDACEQKLWQIKNTRGAGREIIKLLCALRYVYLKPQWSIHRVELLSSETLLRGNLRGLTLRFRPLPPLTSWRCLQTRVTSSESHAIAI